MTWIRENKFLTGFFAILLVGAGVLGYLVFSAYGSYGEISDKYEKQSRELKRLQNLTPYPDEPNLTKLRAQKDGYLNAAFDLQKSLAVVEFPVQPMTPEKFQDNLRATVSKIAEKATSGNITLPAAFYLGFDRPTNYQTTLPKPEAAAPLGRQLAAIDFVVNQLLDNKIEALTALVRTPLPEEAQAEASPTPGARPAGAPKQNLVVKNPFTVSFTAEQSNFRKWLDQIASTKNQFYIVRLLTVQNQNLKGPSRIEPESATSATIATPEAGPAASPTPPPLRFIVGTEKVNVTAQIDIVDFTAPAGK